MAPSLLALFVFLLALAHALPGGLRRRADGRPPVDVVNPDAPDMIPDSYMVVLKEELSKAEIDGMVAGVRAKVKRHNVNKRSIDGRALSPAVQSLSMFDWNALALEADPALIKSLADDARVKEIEADHRFTTPEFSAAAAAGGLQRRQGAKRDKPCQPEKRNDANSNNLGQGTTIFVLDTGINPDHQEFTGRVQNALSFVPGNPDPGDVNGHGTHVAAIAAGETVGRAPKTNIVAMKVLGDAGGGSLGSIIAGMQEVSNTVETNNLAGKAVINMSLGSSASKCLDLLMKRASENGIVPVVAAGNNNTNAAATSPARAPGTITVGAVNDNNVLAGFSNIGRAVDIFADGVQICSANNKNTSGYKLISGTSQGEFSSLPMFFVGSDGNRTDILATSPDAAGAAAVILNDAPQSRNNQEVLSDTVKDIMQQQAQQSQSVVEVARGNPRATLEGATPLVLSPSTAENNSNQQTGGGNQQTGGDNPQTGTNNPRTGKSKVPQPGTGNSGPQRGAGNGPQRGSSNKIPQPGKANVQQPNAGTVRQPNAGTVRQPSPGTVQPAPGTVPQAGAGTVRPPGAGNLGPEPAFVDGSNSLDTTNSRAD